jgi:tetratricopeptide (TPR) repeat protein
VTYEALGRHDESGAELENAYILGYNITNILDLLKLGDIFIKKEDHKTAVSFYEKAVLLQPENYKIGASLAAGYAKIGEYEKARQAALIVLQIAPPEYQEQARQFLESIEGK